MITGEVKTIWIQASWLRKNGFGFIKICLVLFWVCAWGWVFGKWKWNLPGLKLKQYSNIRELFTDQEKKMNTQLINPARKLVVGTEISELKTKQKLLPLARLKSKLAPNLWFALFALFNKRAFPSHDSLRVVRLKELEEARTELMLFLLFCANFHKIFLGNWM